jgi:hypothetical protein
VDLDEILCGGDDIEDDLDSICSNPVASTIPTWPSFKFLRWVQILNQLLDLDEVLYGGDNSEGDLDAILFNFVASTIP